MIILTIASIATLVGISATIERTIDTRNERARRADLIRRGYIL